MDKQYNGASKATVMGSVTHLQNKELDSPAQFQGDVAMTGVFFCLFASEHQKMTKETWNHTVGSQLNELGTLAYSKFLCLQFLVDCAQ